MYEQKWIVTLGAIERGVRVDVWAESEEDATDRLGAALTRLVAAAPEPTAPVVADEAETLGRVAWESVARCPPMPPWPYLSAETQRPWVTAALAVAARVRERDGARLREVEAERNNARALLESARAERDQTRRQRRTDG